MSSWILRTPRCFAVIESHNRTESRGDDVDDVGEALKASYSEASEGDVGVGDWRSHYGRDDSDVRIEGIAIAAHGLDDDDLATRTDHRISSTRKDMAGERIADQTQ